jgi:hypothetical protein
VRISLCAIALLAGCAATVPAPPIVNTVQTKVLVPVPCHVALPTIPQWEMSRMTPAASLFDLAKSAAVELRQRHAYEIELLAASKACE